jgi:hypothetical protein
MEYEQVIANQRIEQKLDQLIQIVINAHPDIYNQLVEESNKQIKRRK